MALRGTKKAGPIVARFEARHHATNTRPGISLPEDTVADLRKLANETGLNDKLPF
jgi:LDH2 family malate/lactate/ureidoglycolate dehydrogenase